MLDWLRRKRDRRRDGGELPEYSALRSVPTRGLPPDLAEVEAGESFVARRDTVQRDLEASPRRPPLERPLFVALLVASEGGVLTFDLPEHGGRAVPIFSTPLRAADYIQTLLTPGPSVTYLASSPVELVRMLRDLEGVGIQRLALDRCPRCAIVTTIGSASVTTADDAIALWAIAKATELARLNLYFAYALRAARAGRLEIARDVALETVAHVSLEDPRPHLLLGQVAVALGDRRLVGEAKRFLQFLKLDAWERALDRAIRSGSSDFESAV